MNDKNSRQAAMASYLALAAKADAKFKSIQAVAGERMQCRSGCYGCCRSDLSVFRVEAVAIASFLQSQPELIGRLRAFAATPPLGPGYCGFLGPAGECLIYAVRPLICRSHGAPVKIPPPVAPDEAGPQGGGVSLSVCPLNFRHENLAHLPQGLAFDLNTVNTLLALIDAAFTGDTKGSRIALTLNEILQLGNKEVEPRQGER